MEEKLKYFKNQRFQWYTLSLNIEKNKKLKTKEKIFMRKVILIQCGKTKKIGWHKPKDLYVGNLFKKIYAYAEKLKNSGKYDEIWVLSDKYYLLKIDKKIENYTVEKPVTNMGKKERKEWSNGVLERLKQEFNLEEDRFLIVAGQKYWEFLINEIIKNEEPPLKGLNRGKQLQFLTNNT